ncbi:hypothetical protein LENED_000104 [Lentinula edodes]|uniref:Uncharacterized protein n=1 Tax=Lentinula edodes TaxID=5353 RepID=A0A1Q3DVB6_LENED|nr:hypothetical protein LENED_000104 [Lentinula edodes]
MAWASNRRAYPLISVEDHGARIEQSGNRTRKCSIRRSKKKILFPFLLRMEALLRRCCACVMPESQSKLMHRLSIKLRTPRTPPNNYY